MILGEPILLGGKGETASIFVTGLTSSDTVTATKDGKTWNGVWTQRSNPKWRGLPNGYTQVDRIVASGSQYLPNITFPAKFKFVIKCNLDTTSAYYNIYDGNSSQMLWISDGGLLELNAKTTRAYISKETDITITIDATSGTNTYAYIDDTLVLSQSVSGVSQTQMLLNRSDSQCFKGDILEILLYDETTLILDYVPCKNSSNIYSFYDVVNSVFITPTGTFTGGTEVPQYSYGHLISKLNSYGTYTVTATDGTHTATESVLVDMAEEYDIEMSFAEKSTYLYYLGDECEDITGGWEALAIHHVSNYTALAPTVVKTSTTTRLYHTPSTIAIGSYMTVDFIDATDFTGVMVYATETNASSDGWVQFLGFRTRSGSGQTHYWYLGAPVGKSSHPTGPLIGTFLDKTNNEAYFAITEYYYGGTTSITYKAIAFFKADNISGLSEYGATISEILSNSATLLASENGVREMLKCTGDFMWNALANSTWLSAYNSSAYKSVIDSNSTWAKALALL